MKKGVITLVAAGALAAVSPAQVTKSGAGYLLRVKYVAGQVIRLNSTNKVINATTSKQTEPAIGLPVVLRILAIKGPTAQARMTVGPATVNGKPVMNSQTVVMGLNSRNQASGVQGGAASVGATLPEKPIKVGQTWEALAPISTGTGTVQKISAIYKFVGMKTVNGQGVAVISYEIKGAARGNGTMTLLQKDGTLWSNDLKMQLRTGNAPLTVLSTMKRV